MKTEIGIRLKELRTVLNLTQARFAAPLGVDRGHIAGIETGTRNPSEPLIKSIHFIYCVNETWLKTGQGEMFITPDELLKSLKDRFGEQAFFRAVINMMNEAAVPGAALNENGQNGPPYFLNENKAPFGETATPAPGAAAADKTRAGTGPPELERMINILRDIWAAGDDRLKGWASIQFDRAIPADVVEEVRKKQQKR